MGTIARMAVELSLSDKDFTSGIAAAGKSAESFVDKAAKLGRGMTAGLTVPIVGIATAATAMSSKLNASMANIGSLGVGSERLAEMKSGIQDLSIETGASTEDMADGMYQVVSAFGDGADSMKILRSNAKLAKAGLSSTSEAIALTSAVTKGYNDTSAEMVAHVADLSIQTVALGQTTLPELAGAMGTVTPLAGSLGVGMEDLFAVMATGAGVTGSSSQVATQFRGILQSLMAPTASMTKLTQKMGYENSAAMLKAEGLQKTIEAIVGAAESTGQPLQDFIGSIEGQTLALSLAGPQAETFTKNMVAMKDVAGKADEAFLAQTEGINKAGFSMEQAQRYAEVLGQKIGDALAPALGILLDKVQPLADGLVKLVDQFVKMDSATQGWILVGIGIVAALGPLLMILPGLATGISAVAGALAVLSGPVGLAILAVVALGVAWATNFGGIQDATKAAWENMQPWLADIATWLNNVTKEGAPLAGVKTALESLVNYMAGTGERKQMQIAAVVQFSADFTQATAAWLAWAGPEAQKTITVIANLPKTTTDAVATWWAGEQAAFDAAMKTWKPHVDLTAAWAVGTLEYLGGFAKGFFLNAEQVVNLLNQWSGGALLSLWQALQGAMKEKVRVFSEWGVNVLADLWQAAQDWFAARTINATVAFTPAAAGKPGPYVDIRPPDPTAEGRYPTGQSARAWGGPVLSGGAYLVGEKGPEMFLPNRSGTIVPTHELGGLAAAGEGQPQLVVNNYGDLHNEIDLNALAFAVAERMARRR